MHHESTETLITKTKPIYQMGTFLNFQDTEHAEFISSDFGVALPRTLTDFIVYSLSHT